jgi:lambda repressor-like predicted transcriptional regulator
VESSNLNPRQAFVFPLLAKEGWSILDWANAARVSSATAHDFLRNRTNPYRSTRLKLAKSLGVSIQQLPR